MNNMRERCDGVGDIDAKLKDLEESSKALSGVDIAALPFNLQLELLNAYGRCFDAIENLDKVARNVIVKATLLGLRKEV